MKLRTLVDAAFEDQERRILQALPAEFNGKVRRFRPCPRCKQPMPAASPLRECKPCRG